MKLFKEVRKKTPPGEKVSSKKVDGISVLINKDKNKFVAYVDGDKLDTYNSKREAEKAAEQFVKQFRKMK